jgi:hypothetical protein
MLVHASPPRSLTNRETVFSASKYVAIIAYPKLFRTAYSDAVLAIIGLTPVEAATLAECEVAIERGLATFAEAGRAPCSKSATNGSIALRTRRSKSTAASGGDGGGLMHTG